MWLQMILDDNSIKNLKQYSTSLLTGVTFVQTSFYNTGPQHIDVEVH